MNPQILRAGLPIDRDWVDLADKVVLARPPAIRAHDQIYMMSGAMIIQTLLMHDYIGGQDVVFMGDGDGMSMMFGIFAAKGVIPRPHSMTVLDMDKRTLACVTRFAAAEGFADIIDARAYNAFDPPPEDLRGRFTMFYTNPPYGSANDGLSGVVFLARCMELTRAEGSLGVAVLPYKQGGHWSSSCMARIQNFLAAHGYVIAEMITGLHCYHLPDNPILSSGYLLVHRHTPKSHEWTDRPIPEGLLTGFYGRATGQLPQGVEVDGTIVPRRGHG